MIIFVYHFIRKTLWALPYSTQGIVFHNTLNMQLQTIQAVHCWIMTCLWSIDGNFIYTLDGSGLRISVMCPFSFYCSLSIHLLNKKDQQLTFPLNRLFTHSCHQFVLLFHISLNSRADNCLSLSAMKGNMLMFLFFFSAFRTFAHFTCDLKIVLKLKLYVKIYMIKILF